MNMLVQLVLGHPIRTVHAFRRSGWQPNGQLSVPDRLTTLLLIAKQWLSVVSLKQEVLLLAEFEGKELCIRFPKIIFA